jgi:hypothetical protein
MSRVAVLIILFQNHTVIDNRLFFVNKGFLSLIFVVCFTCYLGRKIALSLFHSIANFMSLCLWSNLSNYTHPPRRGRGVYCFTSVLPSVQDIFRHIFFYSYVTNYSYFNPIPHPKPGVNPLRIGGMLV